MSIGEELHIGEGNDHPHTS
jgi:hypothetical protein